MACPTPCWQVCCRYEVHFISDEIYALSVFAPSRGPQFHSVLSFTRDEVTHHGGVNMNMTCGFDAGPQLPDAERTHVLWGLSKDLGLAGLRLGFLHSYSAGLLACLDGSQLYTCPPVHTQQAAAALLADKQWLDTVYFPTNLGQMRLITDCRQPALCCAGRLERAAAYTTERLARLGVKVLPAQAGLFCWADFGPRLPARTEQEELQLFHTLFQQHKVSRCWVLIDPVLVAWQVYLVPGSMFGCEQPGWFRIILAVAPAALQEGLARIERALAECSNEDK